MLISLDRSLTCAVVSRKSSAMRAGLSVENVEGFDGVPLKRRESWICSPPKEEKETDSSMLPAARAGNAAARQDNAPTLSVAPINSLRAHDAIVNSVTAL